MLTDRTRTIRIECLRYDPETDKQPRWQGYDVPYQDDMSVLQGLQYIKDHLDGSLTFRPAAHTYFIRTFVFHGTVQDVQ